MANEMIVSEQAQQFMPVMPMVVAVQRRAAIVEFTKQIMVKDTDFGVIPGTGSKPSLLKPGAEKLCSFFGLAPVFVPVETIEDWTGADHEGEAFFLYRYRCELYRNGTMIGSGVGSCNSWESKYRYRNGERTCPHCGKPTIIKGKEEFGGGWLCFAKKGGCGAKFSDNDPAIVNQSVGKVKNPDPADVVNTIDKMAQKRALVAATLIAVNASEFFTQDVEDMASGYVDATYTVVSNAPQNYVPAPQHEEEQFGRQEPQRQPAQRKATPAPAQKANGKSNGNGKLAQAPQPEPAPVAELPAVVASWTKPDDAYIWAVGAGAAEGGVAHAKNVFSKIVTEQFDGKFKQSNAGEVYKAFYYECLRRAADAEQEAAAAHDDDEVGNPFEEVAEMAA